MCLNRESSWQPQLLPISAVHLETDAVEFQLCDIRVQNTPGAAQLNPYMKIFVKSQVDVSLSLGQLLKDLMFEEAGQEFQQLAFFNTLSAEVNPICHLLALLGTHHILHVRRVRVKTRIGKMTCSWHVCDLHHFVTVAMTKPYKIGVENCCCVGTSTVKPGVWISEGIKYKIGIRKFV